MKTFLIPTARQDDCPAYQGARSLSRRRRMTAATVALLGLTNLSTLIAVTLHPAGSTTPVAAATLGGRELFFEPAALSGTNGGPFLARGRNFSFEVKPSHLDFSLVRRGPPDLSALKGRQQIALSAPIETITARMVFVGGNARASVYGESELAARINYLVGGAKEWRTAIPAYSKVKIDEVYPGIGLTYYGNQRDLEYDFNVAPGADPKSILIQFQGVKAVSLGENGDLLLNVGGREVRQAKPFLYQLEGKKRVEVAGGYEIRGTNMVSFVTGPYDRKRTLVIDPVFVYSTYFGGNGADLGLSVKVDAVGNVYVAGQTLSTQFPFTLPPGGAQRHMGGGIFNGDAFVAKFDNSGSNLVYFTYLGGNGEDGALDLAVNSAGNAYLAGFTQSTNFPTWQALYPKLHGTPDPTLGLFPPDGFVAELNTNGSAVVFSTYLGGAGSDIADGIALDGVGNIYVTGLAGSDDFPTRNAIPGGDVLFGGPYDAFATKLSPGGNGLLYSTLLGGTGLDEGQGIAADTNGFAYVAGFTDSTDYPVTSDAFQPLLNNTNGVVAAFDGFLTKLSPSGALQYSTYIGGASNDYVYRVTIDAAGNPYVVGPSSSPDFIGDLTVVSGLHHDPNLTNGTASIDAFLIKLEPTGLPLYGTAFGGDSSDIPWDVAVDPMGNAFVVGATSSTNFPATNVFGLFRRANAGGSDVFVTAINTDASAALYSGYFGGSDQDLGYGIAVDAESSAYIVGNTYSTNLHVLDPLQPAFGGVSDSFLAKIRLNDPPMNLTATGDTLTITWPASAAEFVLESAPSLTPPVSWVPVSTPPVLVDRSLSVEIPATNSSSLFRLRRR